jgi:hypothetical protein
MLGHLFVEAVAWRHAASQPGDGVLGREVSVRVVLRAERSRAASDRNGPVMAATISALI